MFIYLKIIGLYIIALDLMKNDKNDAMFMSFYAASRNNLDHLLVFAIVLAKIATTAHSCCVC